MDLASSVGKAHVRRATAPIAGFGMEITGLILMSIQLMISNLNSYTQGAEAMKDFWRVESDFRKLSLELRTEHVVYVNNIEMLLTGILSPKSIAEFLTNPADDRWKEEKFNRMLKQRLGSNYDVYMETTSRLYDTISELSQRLRLDTSGKV